MKHSGVTGRASLPTSAAGAVRNQGIRMRALRNREASGAPLGTAKVVVSASAPKAIIDEGAFENLRVVSLNDNGQLAGSSWLGHLFANCNPDYRTGLAAFLVALGTTLRGEPPYAKIGIITVTYLFAMFVIVMGRSYDSKAGADVKDDSGTASKGPGKTGKP